MSKKVVINRCYGGFSLSLEAKSMYMERTKHISKPRHFYADTSIERDDPDLIAVIESLGLKASSGRFAKLKIITIPDDVDWEVKDYDGTEWIAEKHRTWCGLEDDDPNSPD